MTLQVGQWINDRIRLERRLGAGAMGEVWAASHATLRTEVAVKFILDDALGSVPGATRRFRREALHAARIRSPHVVTTLDYDEMSDGTQYIVMELLDGETLDDRIARTGPIGSQETAEILRQVGKALDAAHAMGIVHRDIKPGNVFLAKTEHGTVVKVLDFGYAKSLGGTAMSAELSSPGMLAGSPAYVSRDLLVDPSSLDHRSDLWALGVAVYKCLTGDLPFKGDWIGETCEAIIEGRMRKPSTLVPQLGPCADYWFTRVFHADPAMRPASGSAMSQSFDEHMWLDITPSWRDTPVPPSLKSRRSASWRSAPRHRSASWRSAPRRRSSWLGLGMAACFTLGGSAGLVMSACSRAPLKLQATTMATLSTLATR